MGSAVGKHRHEYGGECACLPGSLPLSCGFKPDEAPHVYDRGLTETWRATAFRPVIRRSRRWA
jgi:hypothetical protein